MINQHIGKECTGCTACQTICPVNAISMKTDSEGFKNPRVETSRCVQCGICVKTCPVLNCETKRAALEQPVVYAGWNRDESVRLASSSGGVFSAYANAILNRGGVVVGARYTEDLRVEHVLIEDREKLWEICQSKYTQSDMGDVFLQVKEKLEEGRTVLFCGTPCQVAGLSSFLKGKRENLFTCDFICHGVISPMVYEKYIADLARMEKSRAKSIQFKNKDYGWNRFSTRIVFENGEVYQKDRNEDRYTMGYTKHHLYLRPSCHQCRFRNIPREADVSLGDFWGIGKINPELDDDKGTSAILINTEQGRRLNDWARTDLYLTEQTLEAVLAGNMSLKNSPPEGEFREYFFKNIKRKRFDRLIEKIEFLSWHLTPKERVFRRLHLIRLRLMGGGSHNQ